MPSVIQKIQIIKRSIMNELRIFIKKQRKRKILFERSQRRL